MKYESVLFDMDGVILNSLVNNQKWKFDAVKQVLREKDIEVEELSKNELEIILGDHGYKEVVKKCTDLDLNPKEVWSDVARKTTEARVEQIKNGNFALYDGVKDMIKKLHERGISQGLISNAPESAVEVTIEEFDLAKYFSFYLGVRNFEDLQARKPNPNHLEYAKAELDSFPMVYVGDSESDVIAAQRADIDSIWVNRENSNADVKSDYQIEEVSQIIDIIK
ncbi:MAG: HAD family hydrolase [Candidatus Nanohaloarchaea archaeon]